MNRRHFLAAPLLVAGCTRPSGLRVAAAANLKPVVPELLANFPDVTATFGASGTLFQQLRNGAPFALFLSAEADFPTQLPGASFHYARGRIAFVRANGINVLASLRTDPPTRLVIANPRHAPYGRAAEGVLRNLELADAMRPKLLLAESAEQAAQMFDAGAADAAFLPTSMARGTLVPADLHAPLDQAGVVLNAAAAPIRDFILSAAGQAILARFGYEPPGG